MLRAADTQGLFPEELLPIEAPAVAAQWPSGASSGIALVGEAPGSDEARLGQPFVGRAGQLLNRLLERAGIDRSHCLVTNVFQTRPPANKVAHFFSRPAGAGPDAGPLRTDLGRAPSGYLLNAYEDDIARLWCELAEPRLCVVIALGATALWATTGRCGGIVSEAGNPVPPRPEIAAKRDRFGAAPAIVLPTLHPAYLLRRGDARDNERVIAHLRSASQIVEAAGPAPRPSGPPAPISPSKRTGSPDAPVAPARRQG